MSNTRTDFLVIGSGIAGLSFALRTAKSLPDSKITVITKNVIGESNTRYAQGGLAAVTLKEDSFEKHINDTLEAGDGLCDPAVVKAVIEESPKRLAELIAWGATFDKNGDSDLHLAREGGHVCNRIIHRADHTGLEIEQTLVRQVRSHKNIEVLEHHLSIDLHVENGMAFGAAVINLRDNKIVFISSPVTVIAAGGVGQVYKNTTNPSIATGDGIAMAWRAGAQIVNMEYTQFHPTALYTGQDGPLFLVSEAVRGAGAFLINKNGERFMQHYHTNMDLACRDVVSRAIYNEMHRTKSDHVWLDCRKIGRDIFGRQFPTILKKCLSIGIDPTRHQVPVVPAAHYCCGGIMTDLYARTTIKNLYAVGESACTGLHGANRLASNSLSEALVFAARASESAIRGNTYVCAIPRFEKFVPVQGADDSQVETDKRKLKSLMSDTAIVSSDEKLLKAWKSIRGLRERYARVNVVVTEKRVEMRNLICVALLILEAALRQDKNGGTFFKIR